VNVFHPPAPPDTVRDKFAPVSYGRGAGDGPSLTERPPARRAFFLRIIAT
jgi:hypothetical protein